jgi:hypothetical protein
MPDMNPDKAKAIFNNFSEDVKKSDFSKNIKKYIEQDMLQKDSIK